MIEYNSLEIFKSWRIEAAKMLSDNALIPSFFDSQPSANPSMRLDFKGDDLEATIACWAHGNVVVEAYKKSSDEFMPFERSSLESHDLRSALYEYLNRILNWAYNN